MPKRLTVRPDACAKLPSHTLLSGGQAHGLLAEMIRRCISSGVESNMVPRCSILSCPQMMPKGIIIPIVPGMIQVGISVVVRMCLARPNLSWRALYDAIP